MKQTLANEIRSEMLTTLVNFFTERGEDVGITAGGTLNFPITYKDVEGWIEIKVAVPKYEDEEGYALREDYTAKQTEKAEKAEQMAKAKAEKIARDKAEREKKKLEREMKKAEKEGK